MRQVTLERCPRRNSILKLLDRFCSQCLLMLDSGLAKEIEEKSRKVPDALTLLFSNPETQAMIADKLRETIEKK